MKRWRVWATISAVAIAVVAGIIGTLIALGQMGNSEARPSGEHNVLRIASEDTAPCGGTLVASIYLDDLETRPSPYDDKHAFGLASFELPLTYDPKVLQIGDSSNYVLNEQLGHEDDDLDGVTRVWIPASYVNDAQGWASLAGSSYNLKSTGSDKDNQEEGLVPSESGAPILLGTVHFSVIGEGSSSINIEPGPGGAFQPGDIKLYDPANKAYENVSAKAATVAVSNGDCSKAVTSTPIPTRAPMPTDVPVATPTLPIWHTVTAPEATAVGREDCPSTWVAYQDTNNRFSICYPASFLAQANDAGVYLASDQGTLTVAVYWEAVSGYGLGLPSAKTCPSYTGVVGGNSTSTFLTVSLGAQPAPACLTVGIQDSSLHGTLALAKDGTARDGYLRFMVNYTSDDLAHVPDIGTNILDTLSPAVP